MIGIEFTFKDKTTERYDPVTEFTFNDDKYSFYVNAYDYTINVNDIESYREYPICEKCGYELEDNSCENCNDINI